MSDSKKVALITGASSGMGEAVARRFHREGYSLALGARRVDKLKSLAASLGSEEKIFVHSLDLSSQNSIGEFARNAMERFGHVDALVNCAGFAIGREPADLGNVNEWRAMVETDYLGPMALIRALAPGMKERGSGRIINIGALAALHPHPGSAAYASAKEGMRMFLKCLREDLLGSRIGVTNIDPGITRTDFAKVRFRGDSQAVEKMLEGFTPLEAADMAEVVWFAASRPAHVNIDQLTVTPMDQSSPTRLHKRP